MSNPQGPGQDEGQGHERPPPRIPPAAVLHAQSQYPPGFYAHPQGQYPPSHSSAHNAYPEQRAGPNGYPQPSPYPQNHNEYPSGYVPASYPPAGYQPYPPPHPNRGPNQQGHPHYPPIQHQAQQYGGHATQQYPPQQHPSVEHYPRQSHTLFQPNPQQPSPSPQQAYQGHFHAQPANTQPSSSAGVAEAPRRSSVQDLLNHDRGASVDATTQATSVENGPSRPAPRRRPKDNRPPPDHSDKLPYNMADLEWNAERTVNQLNRYCYCGEDRNLLDLDLYCASCKNFFHGRCTKVDLGPIVPFVTNYRFICRNCSSNDTEEFERIPSTWHSTAVTALANLMLKQLQADHPDWEKDRFAAQHKQELECDGWFYRKRDIVPYLNDPDHWHAICLDREVTPIWALTFGTWMIKDTDTFQAAKESERNANSPWRLHDPNLFNIRPGTYTEPRKRKLGDFDVPPELDADEQPRKRAPKVKREPVAGETVVVEDDSEPPVFAPGIPIVDSAEPIQPEPFERPSDKKSITKKPLSTRKIETPLIDPSRPPRIRPPPYKPQDFDSAPRQPVMTQVEGDFADGPYFAMSEIPFNKRGFKYTPCRAQTSLPSIMYTQTEVEPCGPRVEWYDMSPYMYTSRDGLSATTDKGFRMARANICMREGSWYWEVKVLRGNGDKGGHVRLGVARREASLEGPVGFDAYSYGIRDRGGEKLHLSRPRPFATSFGTGDIIGFHLVLPSAPSQVPAPPFNTGNKKRKDGGRAGTPGSASRGKVAGPGSGIPQMTNSGMSVINDRPMDWSVVRDRIPIRYRQQLYFEQPEYVATKEMDDLLNPNPVAHREAGTTPQEALAKVPTLPGSSLTIYINGKRAGSDAAFTDLWSFWPPNSYANASGSMQQRVQRDDGTLGYYPAISCFNGGSVRLNFGPDFAHPCPPGARALADRHVDQIADDFWHDLVDEVEFGMELGDLDALRQANIQQALTGHLPQPLSAKPPNDETSTTPARSTRNAGAVTRKDAATGMDQSPLTGTGASATVSINNIDAIIDASGRAQQSEIVEYG
ncbi:transcription factor, contains a PHD finger motif [Savitreella phatthalungensis]